MGCIISPSNVCIDCLHKSLSSMMFCGSSAHMTSIEHLPTWVVFTRASIVSLCKRNLWKVNVIWRTNSSSSFLSPIWATRVSTCIQVTFSNVRLWWTVSYVCLQFCRHRSLFLSTGLVFVVIMLCRTTPSPLPCLPEQSKAQCPHCTEHPGTLRFPKECHPPLLLQTSGLLGIPADHIFSPLLGNQIQECTGLQGTPRPPQKVLLGCRVPTGNQNCNSNITISFNDQCHADGLSYLIKESDMAWQPIWHNLFLNERQWNYLTFSKDTSWSMYGPNLLLLCILWCWLTLRATLKRSSSHSSRALLMNWSKHCPSHTNWKVEQEVTFWNSKGALICSVYVLCINRWKLQISWV